MAELSPAEWTAIWLSLKIAIAATIASLPFGILVSYALARWRFPGKTMLNAAVHLLLVMPPAVIGFPMLVFWPERRFRRLPRQYRDRIVVSLDRRSGGLRGDGISAHGMEKRN